MLRTQDGEVDDTVRPNKFIFTDKFQPQDRLGSPLTTATYNVSSPMHLPSRGDSILPYRRIITARTLPSTPPGILTPPPIRPTSQSSKQSFISPFKLPPQSYIRHETRIPTEHGSVLELARIWEFSGKELTERLIEVQQSLQETEKFVTKVNEESNRWRTLCNIGGWGFMGGVLSFLSSVVRYRAGSITKKSFIIVTSVTLGTAGLFLLQAMKALSKYVDQQIPHTLGRQNAISLKRKYTELVNIQACRSFYSPTLTQEDLKSGDTFLNRSALFDTKYHLSDTQTNDLVGMINKLATIRPLPPHVATALAVEIAALTIFNSNRIEKAGLPLSETEVVIRGLQCPANSDLKSFFETWYHAKALAMVVDMLRSGLTRETICSGHMKNLHFALMAEEPTAKPGEYREKFAYISSNPTQVLPNPTEIPSLVERIFQYVNNSDDNLVEILINFHQYMIRVHPFSDGNGRIVRLVCTFLALSAGYAGFSLMRTEEDEYVRAIREWETMPELFGDIVVRELLSMLELYETALRKAESKRRR